MSMKGIAVMAAIGLAAAAPHLTATQVRIGDHPAFVRVVVDFSGGILKVRDVHNARGESSDNPFTATVVVQRRDAATRAAPRTGFGLTARVTKAAGFLRIDMHGAHKFKYLSYAVITGNRLAIDLWKTTPYGINKPIHTCKGLTLSGWSANGSRVEVGGREHGIFENQFEVVLRGAKGVVIGRKIVRGAGRWRTRVQYHVAISQPGWVEAVALSPKDGSLACIAELGINLPAS